MRSKVVAAEMASAGGTAAVIANGSRAGVIRSAIAGHVGTRFHADERPISAFKLWVRYGRPSSGQIEIDSGARRALIEDGASLLPVGVTGVRGRFVVGDAVDLVGPDGVTIGKGLAEVTSTELQRSARSRGGEPAVHRDTLFLDGGLRGG